MCIILFFEECGLFSDSGPLVAQRAKRPDARRTIHHQLEEQAGQEWVGNTFSPAVERVGGTQECHVNAEYFCLYLA